MEASPVTIQRNYKPMDPSVIVLPPMTTVKPTMFEFPLPINGSHCNSITMDPDGNMLQLPITGDPVTNQPERASINNHSLSAINEKRSLPMWKQYWRDPFCTRLVITQ